jgi:hypothetical protein
LFFVRFFRRCFRSHFASRFTNSSLETLNVRRAAFSNRSAYIAWQKRQFGWIRDIILQCCLQAFMAIRLFRQV